MDLLTFLSVQSEKAILLRRIEGNLPLETSVDNHQNETTKKIDNPLTQDQTGIFTPTTRRSCATTDMEIIQSCINKNISTPSFLTAGPREDLYYNPRMVKAGIVTTGGVAPGLNTVIHGIVNMHEFYGGNHFIYGFRGGFKGLIEDDYRDIEGWFTKHWPERGGTQLGTIRGDKLVDRDFEAMISTLNKYDINILYVIGGNGSMAGAHAFAKYIKEHNITIRSQKVTIVGVPKTIDNDLLWVDRSFGFVTAVEEAMKAISTIQHDTRSTARICLIQIFGRGSGFIAAQAALANGLVDVVLVPEVEFEINTLLDNVEKTILKSQHYATIVVAEGATPKEYPEDWIFEQLEGEGVKDARTNKTDPKINKRIANAKLEYLESKFEERFVNGIGLSEVKKGDHIVFTCTPRHLLRSVPACAVDQVLCRRLSEFAVHSAMAGYTDFMISEWLNEFVLIPLKLVVEEKDPFNTDKILTKKIPPKGTFWMSVINNINRYYELHEEHHSEL